MPTQHEEQDQSQQWIVVTKNKNKHKGAVKNKQIHDRGHQNILKPEHKHQYTQKFIAAKSFDFNNKIIVQALEKAQAMSSSCMFHVECLGLGNFLANKKCFIQLQLMELVLMPIVKEIISKKQNINLSQKHQRPLLTEEELSVNVYDPAFSKEEIKHLNETNYTSVEKFQIKQGKINIFFMPHCERFLYEAVYTQYEKIQDKSRTPLIVVGNSIQEYKERCLLIKEKIPDIFQKIQLQEQRIFDFQNALNDTFVLS